MTHLFMTAMRITLKRSQFSGLSTLLLLGWFVPLPRLPHPPVLAASTVSGEWLGEDGHFLLLGKAGTLVSWEFQLHSRVQQGEVAPHNQGMRGAYRQGD